MSEQVWNLIDCLDPLEEDEENPVIPIPSETRLREELTRLQQREPGLVYLAGPARGWLALSIGGPFAGLGWIAPPADQRIAGNRVALPDRISSPRDVSFATEGIATPIQAEELFPVDEVIEAAAYYYRTSRLPDWFRWRTWNPASKRWEVQAAHRVDAGRPETTQEFGAQSAPVQAGGEPAADLGCPSCAAVVNPPGEEAG